MRIEATTMIPEEFTIRPNEFKISNYSSLAALVILLLDHGSTCTSEYTFIWRTPSCSAKHLYLFARYFSLAVQVLNYCLIHTVLVHAPVKVAQCQAWFTFLFVSSGLSLATLDAILLLRVYALYQKNLKVCLLVLPLSLPFIISFGIGRHIYINTAFNPICVLQRTPFEAAFLVPTVVIAHMAVWVTTFARRNVAHGQAAVVRLVVHEGAWTVVVFCAIVAAIAPYSYTTQSSNPFVIYVWPTTVFSITSCRLIMNMRRLKTEPTGLSISSVYDLRLSTVLTTFQVDGSNEGAQIQSQTLGL
ncbi:hypothetical protein B0H34DRAFT_520797 [Crassisporium funariophilum]|nr:hypothetical protein B0H34DRAFT_520797 [Crassisporium funariophilum]